MKVSLSGKILLNMHQMTWLVNIGLDGASKHAFVWAQKLRRDRAYSECFNKF